MQTAIVIKLEDGTEVLVTIYGVHLDEGTVHAAERSASWFSWGPPLNPEIRLEN